MINKYYIKREDMKKVDELAISTFPIEEMMLLAGQRLANFIIDQYGDKPIAIVVGSGRNGGGGLFCTKALASSIKSNIYLIPLKEEFNDDFVNEEFERIKKQVIVQDHLPEVACIVDAILGYNFDKEKEPLWKEALEIIESINNSGSEVVSLDVPSGLDTQKGEFADLHIKANKILTLDIPKHGLEDLNVWIADLGFSQSVYDHFKIPYTRPDFKGKSFIKLETFS